jgi:hypothetical protein
MFNCAKAARSHSYRADLAARGSHALARAKGCELGKLGTTAFIQLRRYRRKRGGRHY